MGRLGKKVEHEFQFLRFLANFREYISVEIV